MTKNQADTARSKRHETMVAVSLLLCVVLVGIWEFLAGRSRRPFVPFQITAADFVGFQPHAPGWRAQRIPIQPSRIEPNILSYLFQPATPAVDLQGSPLREPSAAWAGSLLVRLVHGYNMPDCMRIKGYAVELIADTRQEPRLEWENRPLQIWRLTSKAGEHSIWVTSLLRAGDFLQTDDDIRSMVFPRIGTPDDPHWLPRGIRAESFLHPVRNFRWLIRAKWNNARCDLATFLKLKQPAWASDDLLSLVATTEDRLDRVSQEPAALEAVVAAHGLMSRSLQSWRAVQLGSKQEPAQPSADSAH